MEQEETREEGGTYAETKRAIQEALRKSLDKKMESIAYDPYCLALRLFYAYAALAINDELSRKVLNPGAISPDEQDV